MKRISLRWRLVLVAWLQAVAIGALLVIILLMHHQRYLRDQLDRTLETKCDEVITILGRQNALQFIDEFFLLETQYRFSRSAYFYQLTDEAGAIVARSQNLGDVILPSPEAWQNSGHAMVHLISLQHPLETGQNIRVRSETVVLGPGDGANRLLLIQTAGALESLERAMRQTLRDDLFVLASALVTVLFLLWFVTSRALQPVAAMTTKASEVSARNLRERLPVTGNADELDELACVLNSMLDRLAGALRRTEGFSSDAAHQLRTRLARIRGELDLALKSGASDKLLPELESIREDVDQMSQICSRLLLLARLDRHLGETTDSGGEMIRLDEQVNLQEVVAELVEQLTPLAKESGVSIRCDDLPAVTVLGNRALIVEALLNLLDNAVHYSRGGGSVSTAIDTLGETARVSITDSGPGVPPDERHRIFERFYQGRQGVADEKGSGLGLAIVRSIARAHGGYVELADAPSETRGSVFRFILPL